MANAQRMSMSHATMEKYLKEAVEYDSDSCSEDSSERSATSSLSSVSDSSDENLGNLEDEGDRSLAVGNAESEPAVDMSRSVPNMQFNFDLDGAKLSTDDDKSMRGLLTRMNSCASFVQLTEDYDKDEEPEVPQSLDVKCHKKKIRRTISKDDMALVVPVKAPSPHHWFQESLEGTKAATLAFPDSYWESYFADISNERIHDYTIDMVKAVRSQDIDTLKKLWEEQGSSKFDACNSQGESIVHLAARRRNASMLRFLVSKVKVSLKVRDDWGKTPLHELCWNSRPKSPSQFDSIRLVLQREPELLFAKDRRGFTPFQYVPKDCWNDYGTFLEGYKKFIRAQVQLVGFRQSRERMLGTLERANSTLTLLSGNSLTDL